MLQETITTVCNKALALIGEEPINSINDNTSLAARVCKSQYEIAFHSVLEAAPWPCILTEAKLARVDYPEYSKEQKSVYAIPEDCANIVRVYTRHQRKMAKDLADWDIRYINDLADKYIVCNKDIPQKDSEGEYLEREEEALWIDYIKYTENMSLFSASFLDCLIACLATRICMPITKDVDRFASMTQYYDILLKEAKMRTLNEVGEEKVRWVDPITASRG